VPVIATNSPNTRRLKNLRIESPREFRSKPGPT
jgi:hypothetical protein